MTSQTTPEPHFFPSQSFTIRCGCIPIDPTARKIAIIRQTSRSKPIHLPRGTKNINEDLLTAALRESYEETGIPFHPLPLKIATRAWPTARLNFEDGVDPDVAEDVLNCEPSSVCVEEVEGTGRVKIVFWFAARGDAGVSGESVGRDPWVHGMEVLWVGYREAVEMMTWESDKRVIEKVLEDMRNSGYDV